MDFVRLDKELSLHCMHLPSHNKVLAALPPAEYARILPHLELTEWKLGAKVCTGGSCAPYQYFPITGIAGLMRPEVNCRFSEVAVTGNDGVVGMDLFWASDSPECRAVVVIAGHAYRLEAATLSSEFTVDSPLQQSLMRYTQSMIAQIARTAACNRRHAPEERVCRWLLNCLDRTSWPTLRTTPGAIAGSLALDVAEVAAILQYLEGKAIVTVHPEQVLVDDRLRLEARACECHALIHVDAMRWIPYGIAA